MRDLLVWPQLRELQQELDLLVLASGSRSCVGIDLSTGALVRTHQARSSTELLRPYDTARARIATAQTLRPEQPEALAIGTPLTWTGSLFGWRVDRCLRSVSHPEHAPLFGCAGPALPVWTLDGDRPSVSVLPVDSSFSLNVSERGVRCSFRWNTGTVELPLDDASVLSQLDWLPASPLAGRKLHRAIGFRPHRVVVALSRPIRGYCYKVVAGLLPPP